jgi:hypothetical protein
MSFDAEQHQSPHVIQIGINPAILIFLSNHAVQIIWAIFSTCAALLIFAVLYLQRTLLGFVLCFAGFLVGYECLYLLRKLAQRRSR